MNFAGGGHNPVFGRDPGPPPPSAPLTGPSPPPDNGPPPPGTTRTDPAPAGQPFYAIPATQPGNAPIMAYWYGYYPAVSGAILHAAPAPAPAAAIGTAIAVDEQGRAYQYISGLNGSGRHPQPAPVVDPDFPAANLINSTGGAGAEPGYNYFFPTQHAKVVVLKCATPPWTLVPGTYGSIPFHACKVPASVTMAELLAGFGADNPDRARNQLWEVYPQGGGRWGWREHLCGDDDVMMARTVRDMGWVEKRDGAVQTVYLWISKG